MFIQKWEHLRILTLPLNIRFDGRQIRVDKASDTGPKGGTAARAPTSPAAATFNNTNRSPYATPMPVVSSSPMPPIAYGAPQPTPYGMPPAAAGIYPNYPRGYMQPGYPIPAQGV